MRASRPLLVIAAALISAAALGSGPLDSLRSSPCLSTKPPGAKASLTTLRKGASLWLTREGGERIEVGGAMPACIDPALDSGSSSGRHRVVSLGRGLAVMFFADPPDVASTPVDAKGWQTYRATVKEEPQQVGCLKRFSVGTPLYDQPDGTLVGMVVDSKIAYGKWDHVQTPAPGWSMMRVSVGEAGFPVWVKDGPGDWCGR